jgi:hypothetical protein
MKNLKTLRPSDAATDEQLKALTALAYEKEQAIKATLEPLKQRVHELEMQKQELQWDVREVLARRRLLGKMVTHQVLWTPTSEKTGRLVWMDPKRDKCRVDFGGTLGIVKLRVSEVTAADRELWQQMLRGDA